MSPNNRIFTACRGGLPPDDGPARAESVWVGVESLGSPCPESVLSGRPGGSAEGALASKYRFVRHVERLEGFQILHLAQQDQQLMKRPR